MKTIISYTFAAAILMASLQASAQDEATFEGRLLDDLSLEELMRVPINSASKKDETLFDAPLSSYTITRNDIDRAGSTSIMEALRLAPGVIVREQANGAYDIHIRGFDNIQRYSENSTKANLATLVMIDNRPVFNHNLGGTFWEALPIDINDVERIEIVRGPSAPLFGPNAVTGVINIITRRVDKDKTLLNANVMGGSASTIIGNISAGKDLGKFSALASANYQSRDRFQSTYYLPAANQYYTIQQLEGLVGEDIRSQYENPEQGWKKFGANVFLGYEASEKVSLDLSAGTQQSEVQKAFLSNVFNGIIPLTQNETNSSYVNLSAKIHGLQFRSSYVRGHDNLAVNAAPNQYDYNIVDAAAEYSFNIGKIGAIAPGVSIQKATLSDADYTDQGLVFLGGGDPSITTSSAFVRADIEPIKNLRVIAALRADKFSVPDDVYLAYEFASTYKINEDNIVRAAVTRSNSGSFIGYNHLDLAVPIAPGLDFVRTGATNLDLYTVNMIEVGNRTKLTSAFHVDLDVFRQKVENLTALYTTYGIDPGNGSFQATRQQFLNAPMTAVQTGLTLAVNFAPNDKFHLKPFVTIQSTKTSDLPSSFVEPTLAQNLGAPVQYTSSKHESTPSVYGGYYFNYKPTKQFSINLNGYFFAAHRQYDQTDLLDTSEAGDISGKFILNAKVSYALKNLNLFVNGRNILNSESPEFYGTDRTSSVFLAGASFSL